jgi:hypothetical protein
VKNHYSANRRRAQRLHVDEFTAILNALQRHGGVNEIVLLVGTARTILQTFAALVAEPGVLS